MKPHRILATRMTYAQLTFSEIKIRRVIWKMMYCPTDRLVGYKINSGIHEKFQNFQYRRFILLLLQKVIQMYQNFCFSTRSSPQLNFYISHVLIDTNFNLTIIYRHERESTFLSRYLRSSRSQKIGHRRSSSTLCKREGGDENISIIFFLGDTQLS